MKNLVGSGMVYGLMWLLGSAFRGRPIPVVIGLILGIVGGSCLGLVHPTLYTFGAVFGAILGSALLGLVFPRPEVEPPPKSEFGTIQRIWQGDLDGKPLHVVTDRVYYDAFFCPDDIAGLLAANKSLENGERPTWENETEVNLQYLREIECRTGGKSATFNDGRSTPTTFGSTESMEEVFLEIEKVIGQPFQREEMPLPLPRALRFPIIILMLQTLLTCGVAKLSANWIVDPPIPRNKNEPDAIAQFLMDLEPSGVFMWGAILCLPVALWLLKRGWSPPLITVLKV